MAIAFVSVGAVLSTSNSGSVAVPYPAGLAAGNALTLCVANSIPKAYTTPSPWTQIQGSASVGSDLGFDVYTTIALGTETGTLTLTATLGTGLHSGIMLCHSGVDAVTPFGTSNLATGSSGASTSPALTALSPGANDWVIRFYCWGADSSTGSPTLTNPGGTWTTRKNQITAVATDLQAGCVAADKQAGVDSQTITSSTTGAFAVTSVILVAAAAAAAAPPVRTFVSNRAAIHRASNY